jgi:rRNA maturation protein Nop10
MAGWNVVFPHPVEEKIKDQYSKIRAKKKIGKHFKKFNLSAFAFALIFVL